MRNFIRIAITMSLVTGSIVVSASTAVAGDDKAKAPTPAPAAAKPAPAKPTPAPTPADKPAAQMEMPKAPAEVAASVKAAAGTWKCQGSVFAPDGSAQPMKATMKTKVALDNFWAQTTFAETKKGGYKFESYRTFDGKKWHSVMVDNMGGQEVGTSDGFKENKMTWESMGRSVMGEAKARHYEEIVGKEIKMWGEWSMDKGKTWVKGYEATCKK